MKKISGCIKLVIISGLVISSCQSGNRITGDGSEWLRSGFDIAVELEQLNETDFYEVSPTKEAVALSRLTDKNIIELDQKTAEWYTGPYYKCEEGKQPFLVRSVYGHGGTGGYIVLYSQGTLLIIHGSLGHSTVYNKSALVVNLPEKPEEIYLEAHIDE